MTTSKPLRNAIRSMRSLAYPLLLLLAAGCGGSSAPPPQGQTPQPVAAKPAAEEVPPKAQEEPAPVASTFGVNGDLVGVTTSQQFLAKYPTGYLTPTTREGVEQAEPYPKDAPPESVKPKADGIPVSYFAYEFVDGRLELIDATSRHPDAYEQFLKAFTAKYGEPETVSPAPARSAQWKENHLTLILSEMPEGAANFNFMDQDLARIRRDRPKTYQKALPDKP